DSCISSTDCSIDGTRVCDISQLQGYCTIAGCDYDTCPGEAACISFFSGGGFTNRPCDPKTEDTGDVDDCSVDELCSIEGQCVPRSSESRFCMKKCDQSSDCRDGYECRDLTLMTEHGGQPVLPPPVVNKDGTLGPKPVVDNSSPHFCAMAPAS
ncbi:MAG TPA: hypothetical protein VGC41_25325, partial [Kofleriaceae bacterium]